MSSTPLVIGIGSNMADRSFFVEKAIEKLNLVFSNASLSSVYESPSVNGDGTIYANAVYAARTVMGREEVEELLKRMEREAGRTGLGDIEREVPLDLDLVIWNGQIVRPDDFERPYFNIGYRYLLANGAFQYTV